MTFNVRTSCIRTVRKGDNGFIITDGLVATPRAGFELSNSIPRPYVKIISECIDNGWLKPVAHVKDSELFWEEFQK